LIAETGGGTAVSRGGTCGLHLVGCTLDSYTVALAQAPTSDVWVTVSAEMSPQGLAGADTAYLCTGTQDACSTDAAFFRTVLLDGTSTSLANRSLVLHFTPSNYATPQTVWVAAADDTAAEGDIVIAISHSVVSADNRYAINGPVRNVEVTIHDNIAPGVAITQLDSGGNPDGVTTVIKGTTTTQLIDTFTIAPPSQPSGSVTYVITPTDNLLTLSGTGVTLGSVVGGIQTYRIKFTNTTAPVTVTVTAVNNFVPSDPHYTTLTITVDGSVAGADPHFSGVSSSFDVLILDDNAPGVYVAPTGGSTAVSAGPPAVTDSYSVRLLDAPAPGTTVTVGLIGGGQTTIATGAGCSVTLLGHVCLVAVGHQGTRTLFTGNVTISGNTITLANGSELENFMTAGFAPGQRLVIGGTAAGANPNDDNPCANQSCSNAYLITAVTANTITLSAALAASGSFGPFVGAPGSASVTLSRVVPAGLFTATAASPVTYATGTDPISGLTEGILTRADGGSWLDNGFVEGQLVQFTGVSGVTGTYKIQSIFGTGLSQMSLFLLGGPATSGIAAMPASSTSLSITEFAPVITFDSTNWYTPVTVTVAADPFFAISPARANLTVFPKTPHYLAGIRGPLEIDGGTGGEHHSLTAAVTLPHEFNTPPFGIAQQPSEAKQVDVLNIYDDGSRQDLSGTLSSTTLTGFGMGQGLSFPGGTAFGEPPTIPGGISFGTISVDPVTGQYSTAAGVSTIEILNIMLGQGNDTLSITGTLNPGADQAGDDKLPVGIPSLYGALTVVQGGGNALLAATGTFALTANTITRTDNVSWASAGFAVGQQINLPAPYAAGAFTITAITGANGQTLQLSGGTLTGSSLSGRVGVYDPIQPDTGFTKIGGDHITVSCGGGAGCAGPTSPLVIYGDTSQDGIWYSGDPNEQAGHVFGPKPTTEPVGNNPNFVFPLAQPFQYSGNDVIDASALFAGLTTDATKANNGLPTVGMTVYGGAGNDTILGSQTGDIVAGGSGNDTINGLRGNDLIYGDNGLNVDVLSRVISVVAVNGSALPNADNLFAGHDLIQGDGPGSAPDTTAGATSSQDVIFGDQGSVTQDVQGQRYWYLNAAGAAYVQVDSRPQAIQTTGVLMDLATVNPQNGVSDTIDSNLGNDLVFGGGGSDTIAGSDGNDLVFGDFGSIDCVKTGVNCMTRPVSATSVGTTFPIGSTAYVDASLLPFDVALNDHTFTWTSLTNGPTGNYGNDQISGGNGNDILIGGAGADRISGDAGDDDIIGGNTGLTLAGVPNSGGAGGYNAGVDFSGRHVAYGDVYGFTGGFQHSASGGFDGGHSSCATAGACTYGDYLDGGSGNDVIAGDNANLLRTGSTVSPQFRLLSGTDLFNTNSAIGASNVTGQSAYSPVGTPPCAWVDAAGQTPMPCQADSYQWQMDPQGVHVRSIQLFDQAADVSGNLPAGTYSDSSIAGGAGNDVLFGQGGNDWIQGDGSVVSDAGQVTIDVQTRDAVTDPRQSVADYAGPGGDGNDYIEGNAGSDVIYGGLGQDSLVGGSSNMFSLVNATQRSDGNDTIYGGAGTQTAINNLGDLGPNGHAHDADVILGDNGDIYRLVGAKGSATTDANAATKPALQFLSFNYDIASYDATEKIIVRGWTLLDYTYASPTNNLPGAADIGGPDLVQGENGNDVILGGVGSDVLLGNGQDDTMMGGNGNDRIYGGSGDDAILGDNGYYNTSRNGLTEPLWDVTVANPTNVVQAIPGPYTDATTFQAGDFFQEARLFDYIADPAVTGGFADIIYGGLGNDWIHGGTGDDAISGAEALAFYYSTIPQSEILAQWGIDPVNPLLYNLATTKFADYNAVDPWSKIYDCTDGTKDIPVSGTCTSGQKVDFFLNFTPYVLDASGVPILDGSGSPVKSNDGCDIIYGDNGNDWIVGGTDTNWLFGGFGDDLLQSSQNLETQSELNRIPEAATWSDPTFAYGGAGRDVLIADSGRARMYDWSGEFNSFIVPFSPFGAPVVNRSFSPWIRDFIRALSVAGGADQTFTPGSPLDELALSTPQDSYWQAQKGGPRDPQPGNVPGVQIDYRGNVDLGVGCPCDAGDAIAVQGEVNGQVEETPPGLVLPTATPIVFTYLVSDPATQSLKIISIVDDHGTPTITTDDFTPLPVLIAGFNTGDTNHNGLLDPTEVWVYTSQGVPGAPTAAAAGGHQDIVTVVGLDQVKSVQVTASDPINYTGTPPGLSIGTDLNAVNQLTPTVTEQADAVATGPTLAAGAPVVFTYRVTTTSSTPLSNVTVISVDAFNNTFTPLPELVTFQAQQYNVGDVNFDGLLEVGEVWLYTSSGAAGAPTTADAGINSETGTATATAPAGTLTASNPAFYTGTTGIGLVKAVNAVDPTHPTAAENANTSGPIVAQGSTVTYSYLVINSSNSPISITALVDDNATPALTIDDASLANGKITAGLVNFQGKPYNIGDLNHNGTLDPGESWVYLYKIAALLGTHVNTATVTAIDGGSKTIKATDTATYTGQGAAIVLHTAVNAVNPQAPTVYEDANSGSGPYVNIGSSITYTYLVVNTGFLQLNAPGVTSPCTTAGACDVTRAFTAKPVLQAGTTFNVGDTNKNGLFDIGESWLYTSAGATTTALTALTGLQADNSSVSATPVLAGAASVTATDPTFYTGVTAGITVKKAINAVNPLSPTALEDANSASTPVYLAVGSPLSFTYLVSAPTSVIFAMASIVLTDDGGVPGSTAIHPTLTSGDKNGNGLLDKGEVWLYTYTITAQAGLNGNMAIVTATASGKTYQSNDPAWYYGVSDAITVKKAINAANPLAPTVIEEGDTTAQELYLTIGSPLTLTYLVKNTGNSPLKSIALTDSLAGVTPTFTLGDTNGNGVLDPGETWLYTATVGGALSGQQLTSASVTGVDTHLGATVTATNPADY
ncbi:MAG: hypothetical protein ACJ780_04640, partial [Solirubrobacteraceae bacterium]